MQPAKIEKLIKKRHRIPKKDQKNNPIKHTTNTNTAPTIANLNKRKRDISLQQLSKEPANQTITKSISQLSIEQSPLSPSSKKMKNIRTTQTMMNPIIESNHTNTNININYQYVLKFLYHNYYIHIFFFISDDLCI